MTCAEVAKAVVVTVSVIVVICIQDVRMTEMRVKRPVTGADNYSLYVFSELIIEINFSVDLLADQNAIAPTHISGLSEGNYYYVAVAFNGTGQTMSNCLHIVVYLSAPEDFILSSTAGDPDIDGVFDLSWTMSFSAVNYSVYEYDHLIVEINGSLNELAYQTATLPFQITQPSNG